MRLQRLASKTGQPIPAGSCWPRGVQRGGRGDSQAHGGCGAKRGSQGPVGRLRAEARRGHLGRCGADVELGDVGPLALCGLELGGTQDLDAGRLGPAEARHVLVWTVRVRVRDGVEAEVLRGTAAAKGTVTAPLRCAYMPLHCCRCQHWRIAALQYSRDPAQQAVQRLRCASHTMAGRQRTEGVDGVGQRDLTVLLVGVVRAGTRVVPEPDAKVLDLLRGLLEDLRKGAGGVRHERAAWG